MKVYKKPEVRIERFTLSKHIAACDFDMQNASTVDLCTAEAEEWNWSNLFTDTNTACAIKYEGYCYTNSSDTMTIFNS